MRKWLGLVLALTFLWCSAALACPDCEKIDICHWANHKYVSITVDMEGLNGHGDHPQDIIPPYECKDGCPDNDAAYDSYFPKECKRKFGFVWKYADRIIINFPGQGAWQNGCPNCDPIKSTETSTRTETETKEFPCDTGYTGTITKQRTVTYTKTRDVFTNPCDQSVTYGNWSTETPSYGEWKETSNTCKVNCVPLSEVKEEPCPEGQYGVIKYSREYSCLQGTWTEWVVTESTCKNKCVPTTETKREQCPVPYSDRYLTYQRDFLCPGGTWTEWKLVAGNCDGPPCGEYTEERKIPCPTGQTGIITQARKCDSCSNTCQGWVEVTNTCLTVCVPQKDTKEEPCAEGYAGIKKYIRELICPAGTWTEWVLIEDACTKIVPCEIDLQHVCVYDDGKGIVHVEWPSADPLRWDGIDSCPQFKGIDGICTSLSCPTDCGNFYKPLIRKPKK